MTLIGSKEHYDFSTQKNRQLIAERDISFEVIAALNDGQLLDVISHYNEVSYAHQWIFSLDAEEKDLLESVERGEWQSVENIEEEKAFARQAAENYLKKDARLNIRISSNDLSRLKQQAAYKGLPYQTFIASVLHEYAAGHFNNPKRP